MQNMIKPLTPLYRGTVLFHCRVFDSLLLLCSVIYSVMVWKRVGEVEPNFRGDLLSQYGIWFVGVYRSLEYGL